MSYDKIINTPVHQYVLVKLGNGEVTTIEVPVGNTLATKFDIIASENQADILAEAAKVENNVVLEDLPATGEECFSQFYKYGDRIVYCRQIHERTIYPPEQTPALFYFYRDNPEGMEWIEQEKVEVGGTRTYKGDTYTCLQAHVTQADWAPDLTHTLWQKQAVGNVWAVGIAVTVGEEYWYPDTNGTLYRCLQSHTTQAGWTPPVVPALWAVV